MIPCSCAASRPAGGLDHVIDGDGHRQRASLTDDAVEVRSLDKVHDQEMDTPVFVGLERGDQIDVLEPAGRLELAAKPHDGRAVPRDRGGKNLQAHQSTELAVTRLEDHAHAPLAHLVENEIVADQEAATLLLVHRGGLVGSELARLDERARQTENPLGRVGPKPLELGGVGDANLHERARKLMVARNPPGRCARRTRLDLDRLLTEIVKSMEVRCGLSDGSRRTGRVRPLRLFVSRHSRLSPECRHISGRN